MSMISKQVEDLRNLANRWKDTNVDVYYQAKEAADTIETLSAKVRANNLHDSTHPTHDLISRQDALDELEAERQVYLSPAEIIRSLPSADRQDDNRLYIKIYADDEPSRKAEKLYQICGETENQEVAQWLKEYFPSADRPTGKWADAEIPIEGGRAMPIQVCNLCNTFYPLAHTGGGYHFCPNCGARMEAKREI